MQKDGRDVDGGEFIPHLKRRESFAKYLEILHKDLAARIGRLHTPHGTVETPTIMPVINPNLLVIEPREMAKMGAEILITNAYIIYKKEELREEALKRGVHSLLKWDKPLMTDSGSYQLYESGNLEISNSDIIEFQMRVGSDIICLLYTSPSPRDRTRSRMPSSA